MNEISRAEIDDIKRRLDICEERLHQGDTTLALLSQRLGQIDEKLTELTAGVKALQEKPARRWDAIVTQALQWAVALLLGYVALKLKG